MRIEVVDPFEIDDDSWETSYLAVHPARIADTVRTPGWRHEFVVARDDRRVVGLLPVSRPVGRFPAAIFDPRLVAPALVEHRHGDDFLLIGGHFDRASGIAVAPGHAWVRPDLARAAFDHATREGLVGVALYVDEHELVQWDHGGSAVTVDDFSTVHVVGDDADYLAGLTASHRSVVVRDRRALARSGFAAVPTDPAGVVDDAVELLRNVQANHGEPEHPALVQYRLDRWLAAGAGTAVAFEVRDDDGTLLAASFGRHHGEILEMYEIGLRSGIPDRVAVYAEVLIHGPLRFARAVGVSQLRLGSGSAHPKRLRGATLTRVRATTR